jgi:Protein of unknown function (DUF2934)
MGATATVTPGSVQRDSATNKPARTKAVSDSHLPETSMQEDIAKLAYALWEQRGCPQGSPDFDWLEAERKLRESSEYLSR